MTQEKDTKQVKRQFESDENLRIRYETHARYSMPRRDTIAWSVNSLDWRGDERVLDVGCGPGIYYERLMENHPGVQYTGMDLMTGMMQNHPADASNLLRANVLKLPFADGSFDVLMANDMLYHVVEVEQAIQELKRVIKPEGTLMVTTNSINTMPEMQVLMRRAIVLLTRHGAAGVRAPAMPSDNFALENGTRILSRYFYAVVRHDLPGSLVFPDVDPAIHYLESFRNLRETQLPDDVVWEDVMMIMRQQINQLIKHLGELVINRQTGVLLASNKGGFIRTFTELQDSEQQKS
ncbi:MAG: class I SAM-dependent methyltransferase [Aggregatilineales bacterium]